MKADFHSRASKADVREAKEEEKLSDLDPAHNEG